MVVNSRRGRFKTQTLSPVPSVRIIYNLISHIISRVRLIVTTLEQMLGCFTSRATSICYLSILGMFVIGSLDSLDLTRFLSHNNAWKVPWDSRIRFHNKLA